MCMTLTVVNSALAASSIAFSLSGFDSGVPVLNVILQKHIVTVILFYSYILILQTYKAKLFISLTVPQIF